jgi:ABC-type glycerol-3-phosphate transport system substrate-binding protein
MLVTPPSSYYWGGTWLGIYSKAKKANKMIAWEFIKMLCLDDEYMERYVKKTGDFISNMKVVEKIKNSFSDEFLNGQNHYAYYCEEAKKINGSLITEYDQVVEQAIGNRLNEYLTGDITSYDWLIKAIKTDIKTAYPELKVD